jgi:hypothetical protein
LLLLLILLTVFSVFKLGYNGKLYGVVADYVRFYFQ